MTLPPHLPKTWGATVIRRLAGFAAATTHQQRSKYLTAHGDWTQLRGWLAALSGDKCWYCESKSARAPFDVDHFRPKLKVTVNGIRLVGHEGYHWLAYDWSNFRLSCIMCNRPGTDEGEPIGKRNEFPIRHEAVRSSAAAVHHHVEEPKLLDPCVESDCDLLAHGIDGEVRPSAAEGTWPYDRAHYTIGLLGFNTAPMPEEKRKVWNTLAVLIELCPDGGPSVEARLNEHLHVDSEYYSYLRTSIATYRTKDWVRRLL